MTKMKICYFADGESVHIERWVTHFARLGHEVHLISFKKVSFENVTTHYINTGDIAVAGGNWKVLLKYREVKKILRSIKPDIFHSLYATSYGITGALCGFHPYVITTLGTDVLISPKQSKIFKFLLRFAFSKADWVNTLAPHMSDAVKWIGTDMRKVEIVPFGIDITLFNSEGRTEQNDKFVITSTRNFEEVYNIPHFLKALSLVKNEIPNLEIRMAGKGSLKPQIEKMIEEFQLPVTFTGKLSHSDMAKLLKESNLFITVSLSDGNNLSLMEAMSCGAYCIATDIPANRLWIRDKENGDLVQINDIPTLADKILNAYKNYKMLQQKAQPLSKEIIYEMGIWENNMKRVEEKYNSLLKK